MNIRKVDSFNKILWVCPDFYLSFVFTDVALAEVWVHRDSRWLAVRTPLSEEQMFHLALTRELTEEILRCIISAMKKLLFEEEEVIIEEDEIYVKTNTK